MPKIKLTDIENIIELEDEYEFEDKREAVREKEAKNRFDRNASDE